MGYSVTFDKRVKQQVRQLPGKLRPEVARRIADLVHNPRPPDAKELRGYPGIYRIWLTDARYRLIWEVFDEEQRVEVYYVGVKPDYQAELGSPDDAESS